VAAYEAEWLATEAAHARAAQATQQRAFEVEERFRVNAAAAQALVAQEAAAAASAAAAAAAAAAEAAAAVAVVAASAAPEGDAARLVGDGGAAMEVDASLAATNGVDSAVDSVASAPAPVPVPAAAPPPPSFLSPQAAGAGPGGGYYGGSYGVTLAGPSPSLFSPLPPVLPPPDLLPRKQELSYAFLQR
jgi:hypothetical protein